MSPKNKFPNSQAREGVFISYARSDGAMIAADLRERLGNKGVALWQDVVAMEGGRDWWLQITDALDQVKFMALIITPNALKSDTVRKEWRYARQEGVCVYPVKGNPDLDFTTLPHWLRDKHCYDLSDKLQWQKFLNDLNTHCEVPRVPFMAEDLPADFVARPAEFDQLLGYLCSSEEDKPIAIRAALCGAGGYGKSTLASALCHHEDVQDAYDDGILWVTLGEKPGDLGARVADLVETLSGERPGFSDVNAASVRLRELLADRDVLLVIDDVWDSTHLTPFMPGTRRGAQLITTRNVDTLPPNTRRVHVDAMHLEEAIVLLNAGLFDLEQSSLRRLAKRLGEWPLLLKLVNGVLRDRIGRLGQEAAAALGWINTALDRRGLTAFDAHNSQARELAVKKTLSVSLDLLEPQERKRYGELAVFPEDVEVPLVTLARLWAQTGGLDEFETEALCERLDRLSLLKRFDLNRRTMGLHDVIRQYLIGEQGDRFLPVHEALLEAHRPRQSYQIDQPSYKAPAWAELPRDEPYMWQYLGYHLTAAGRGDELIATAKDLRYLAIKTVVRDALAAEQDMLEAEKFAMSDATQRLLRRRFVQSGHVLDRCQDRRDAETTLYSRLIHENQLRHLTDELASALDRPFFVPLHLLPDLPNPALIRTLTGHTGRVIDCGISGEGSLIVSSSSDYSVKLWDGATGALLRTLIGHTGVVTGCTISDDDDLIVSASWDRTVKVWRTSNGTLIHTLTGHRAPVDQCAISADGRLIVSASSDRELRVWDVASGALLRVLSGHTNMVNGCAISGDGRLIVSGSDDETVRLWDVASGRLVRTFTGHLNAVKSCAINSDGSLIVSASGEAILRVWNGVNGSQVGTLTGHSDLVNACAMSRDGKLIVSASWDRTVKIWDSASCECLYTLFGHTDCVPGCAISGDGKFVASASWDRTVKMWDIESALRAGTLHRLHSPVNTCAISNNGRRVISGSDDHTIKVWDTESGAKLAEFAGYVSACAISGDGSFFVSTGHSRELKIWNSKSGELLRTLTGHTEWVLACAISDDGRFIVSAAADKSLAVWDSASGALVHKLSGHTDSVRACAISGDGKLIVSTSYDGTLKVWNGESGALVRTITGHVDGMNGCAIDSDAQLIVSASHDGTVNVWNCESGSLVRTLTGHVAQVNASAISSDGRLIISASEDQTLKLWNSATGECLSTLHVDGPLSSCAIHDEDLIVAGGAGGLYFLRLVR